MTNVGRNFNAEKCLHLQYKYTRNILPPWLCLHLEPPFVIGHFTLSIRQVPATDIDSPQLSLCLNQATNQRLNDTGYSHTRVASARRLHTEYSMNIFSFDTCSPFMELFHIFEK